MVYFNGTIKLTVCEAEDLKPTDFATRHQVWNQNFMQCKVRRNFTFLVGERAGSQMTSGRNERINERMNEE